MADLGQQLRSARQSAGISLEALSARTKIRRQALEAMERGDFDQLPGGVFTRSFIRAYAREVRLDPDRAVAEYRAECGAREAVTGEMPAAPADSESQPRSQEPSSLWVGWTVAAVVLVGFLSVLVSRSIRGSNDVETAVVPTGGAALPKANDAGSSSQQSPVADRSGQITADGLRLEIAPTDVIWLDIQADGQRAVFGLLQPGEHKTIEAHDVILARIGDAGAFRYSINGRPGRSLGGSRQVRDVRITRQTIADFVTSQP